MLRGSDGLLDEEEQVIEPCVVVQGIHAQHEPRTRVIDGVRFRLSDRKVFESLVYFHAVCPLLWQLVKKVTLAYILEATVSLTNLMAWRKKDARSDARDQRAMRHR